MKLLYFILQIKLILYYLLLPDYFYEHLSLPSFIVILILFKVAVTNQTYTYRKKTLNHE